MIGVVKNLITAVKAGWVFGLAGLGIGAAAGWLSLMFVGVPLVAPSYMAQREKLTQAEGAAAGHQDAFEDAEDKRESEYATGLVGLDAERLSCDARVSACEARWSDLLTRISPECPDAETPLYELPVRPVRVMLDPRPGGGLDDG